MNLVLFGCPGAGKGTQAKLIEKKLHIPQISTGDMLRQAIRNQSHLGLKVKNILENGQLVSDELMINLVKERIAEEDCENGFLLDGFPRTVPQAESLKNNHILLDFIIEIRVPDDVIVERLSGRRIHAESGRVYHTKFNPPKVEGKDDLTGEYLVQRPDDEEKTIRQRLALYHKTTEPLVQYYLNLSKISHDAPNYIVVSGLGKIDEINQNILSQIVKNQGDKHVHS